LIARRCLPAETVNTFELEVTAKDVLTPFFRSLSNAGWAIEPAIAPERLTKNAKQESRHTNSKQGQQ
jgi:hypothetical protein